MSFELYGDESEARLNSLAPVTKAETGVFDNFAVGTAKYAMQGFAKTGRAIDMLGAVGPIAQDKIMGTGTEAQDQYFKEHDEVFGRAVDYWTPKPGEVGVAGEVVGQLLGVLPQVFASPGLAIGSTQLSTSEDLINKGVDATKAQAVGAVQAAGLGLGIWMPILGKTLAQRVLAGGVGFNVAQGAASRGASGAILEGTPAEGTFKAFDATSVTLDVLLGAAFGGLAHINPAMRAEGEAMQKRFADWAGNLKPSEVDALATLRQAEHLNVDSMPGKPVDLVDTEAHVQRMRQAIDQLAQDKPVDLSDLPEARIEVDPTRQAEQQATIDFMRAESERINADEGIEPAITLETVKPEQTLEAKQPVTQDGNVGTPTDKGASVVGMEAAARPAETETASLDPLAAEAARFAAENPDLPIHLGKNADGSDITTTARQMLEDADAAVKQARDDVKLFEIAAGCLLGAN